MSFRERWELVNRMPIRSASILLLLAVSLGLLLSAARLASLRADVRAEKLVLAEELRLLKRFAYDAERTLVARFSEPPLPFESPKWTQVQAWSEQFMEAQERLLIVLDRDGRILVHPRLQSDDALRFVDLGGRRLERPDGVGLGPMDTVGAGMVSARILDPDPGLLMTFIHEPWGLRVMVLTPSDRMQRMLAELRSIGRGFERAAQVISLLAFVGAVLLALRRVSRTAIEHDAEEGIVPPW